ncbi:cytochrome P450 monooxygenase-like protein [Bisporella sp. PMI_857]|nr:cytochrome P450 monooxygenase-like protein [Bisporella sp. PMI_857]
MASSPLLSLGSWLDSSSITRPALQSLPYYITVFLIVIVAFTLTGSNESNIPLVNPPKWLQLRITKQLYFIKNGMEILSKSRETYKGKPFRVLTGLGEIIVLPPRFAHIIRNNSSLSFGSAIAKDFQAHIPGFEPFGMIDDDKKLIQLVVRRQLTKYLNTVTEPLSHEATFATETIFGSSSEWQEVAIKGSILKLIARLSSRVFLGDEICRNEDWLEITKEYAVHSFIAAAKLNIVPGPLKAIIHWFSPDCKLVRSELKQARKIIAPVIEKRRALKAQARAEGKPVPAFNDAIDWAEKESNGHPYDAAVFQLLLSFAAIHNTTDLLSQTLILLANEPELLEPLRKEMIEILQVEGWSKIALYNMKLLDSTLKEAQRIKPNVMLPMRRFAVRDVVLPDGITIRKGERTSIDGYNMINPDLYENPEKFDIYRFLRMRGEPGNEIKAQFVSTSPEHLSFGHGHHACPGRFFASNEVKVALCHLLLKYDWKLAPGSTVNPVIMGAEKSVNPETKVLYRRRREEINFDSLGVA